MTKQRRQFDRHVDLSKLIVELQPGNPGEKPFVLMPQGGGDLRSYQMLVPYLDNQLPVYAVSPLGVDGKTEPLTSIEEMVQLYTAALQMFQPNGPYYLGGHSFGGTLAFAVAQHLISLGEKVDFLALIDTSGPENLVGIFENMTDVVLYFLMVKKVDIEPESVQKLSEIQQLDLLIQHSTRMKDVDPVVARQRFKTLIELVLSDASLMRSYIPSLYPNKLHYFLAKERDPFMNQTLPLDSWIKAAQEGIEIYTIPGNHSTMMMDSESLQLLAKYLQQSIQQTRRNDEVS